jgi:DNA-binding response OmpR family regulator
VLVLDDDPTVREAVVSHRRAHGHEVVEPADAEQALRRMGKRPADPVVLDPGAAAHRWAQTLQPERARVAHPGVAHSRNDLLRQVWEWSVGHSSTVTVHVRRLREKVEGDPRRPVGLVTVCGVGYRWEGHR